MLTLEETAIWTAVTLGILTALMVFYIDIFGGWR